MKRLAMTAVLACALSGTALAGDVPSTGSPAPPPPVADTALTGDVSTGQDSALTGHIDTCGLAAVLTVLDLVF